MSLFGSASPDFLRQSSETLAGRITYLELTPFQSQEVDSATDAQHRHWFRGGYPDSCLAYDDEASRQWRSDFITSYVERHLPQQGIAASPIQLRRFCTMLAHEQAGTVNLASIGNALGIDGKTVLRYMDLLEGLFLIRRIPAWSRNTGKRWVKMPKINWRDSGLLHELLGLNHLEHVLGHPCHRNQTDTIPKTNTGATGKYGDVISRTWHHPHPERGVISIIRFCKSGDSRCIHR